MDAAIRGSAGRSTLNLRDLTPAAEPAADADGKPAASADADATPEAAPASEQPSGGRRSRAAQEAAERIAELERQLAERSPEQIRQQILLEQQQQAEQAELARQDETDAARYLRLRDMPDHELSGEDYAFREDYKDLLLKAPRIRAEYDNLLQIERQHMEQDRKAKEDGFWTGVRQELSMAATLPHTNPNDLLNTNPNAPKTFPEMANYYHAAGAAWKDAEYLPKLAAKDAEIQRQAAEIEDLRRFGPRGIASAPAPFAGGQSAGPGAGGFDMDSLIRQSVNR
jgi:hypothetical protein